MKKNAIYQVTGKELINLMTEYSQEILEEFIKNLQDSEELRHVILNKKEWMSVSDVADTLRIHKNTVYTILKSGKVPFKEVGIKKLIRRSDLDKFLN